MRNLAVACRWVARNAPAMCAWAFRPGGIVVVMSGASRPDLFPPDRGLQARMVLAAVGTPLLVAACLVALVALAPGRVLIGVGIAAALGVGIAVSDRARRPDARPVGPDEAPELHAIVERLCVLADLPRPEIVIEPEDQPNSWLVGLRRGRARLHVTRGLLELLSPAELEAVIGHELAHLAHRDAAVMTAVGGPGAVLLSGGRRATQMGWFALIGGFVAIAIGWLGRLGTQALSRHRELAADAGSAALTGRPAALASALLKVSGRLKALPAEDLRVAAARDVFHLLPVESAGDGLRALVSATHPRLETRIQRLERLERAMHGARLAPPRPRPEQ
jgi:heat shock protein HtpX